MSAAAETKVYTYEHDFRAFVAAVEGGDVLEIDAEMFRYQENILPVKGICEVVTIRGVTRYVDFLQGEGDELLTAFWQEGHGDAARYFAQLTHIWNPEA
ncbi:MAG TPA: hypothetical protein VGB98_25765 [Pyrinomonadaceae bacterium]|jgi:hypothetical protein